MRHLLALLALSVALTPPLTPGEARGQSLPPGCFEVCSASCLKPWSIPDPWDDSGRPGWVQWASNGRWDSEMFSDLNGNGLWDPGESFQDGRDTYGATGPKDGLYTAEIYDPLLTGYVAAQEAGRRMTFKSPGPTGPSYYPLDVPIPGGPVGLDAYRWNITNCNPTLYGTGDRIATQNGSVIGPTYLAARDLIARDPNAYWDAACNCVAGSGSPVSPRLVVMAAHDPRVPLDPGTMAVSVVKLVGFFLENASSSGSLTGRLATAMAGGGTACGGAGAGGFAYDCAVPAWPASWGRVKAIYR